MLPENTAPKEELEINKCPEFSGTHRYNTHKQ